MPCITISTDSFICLSNIDFECPHCNKKYLDNNDKYLNRINNNKTWITKVKCLNCQNKFGLTYDYKGDFVTFKVKK